MREGRQRLPAFRKSSGIVGSARRHGTHVHEGGFENMAVRILEGPVVHEAEIYGVADVI